MERPPECPHGEQCCGASVDLDNCRSVPSPNQYREPCTIVPGSPPTKMDGACLPTDLGWALDPFLLVAVQWRKSSQAQIGQMCKAAFVRKQQWQQTAHTLAFISLEISKNIKAGKRTQRIFRHWPDICLLAMWKHEGSVCGFKECQKVTPGAVT